MPELTIQPFTSILGVTGTLPTRHTLRAKIIRYLLGVDKLIITHFSNKVTLVKFVKAAVVPDRLVHTFEGPQLIEYAPNTVENILSVPDDLVLEPQAGLEESDQPDRFKSEPLSDVTLESAGNKIVLQRLNP